MTVFKEYIDAGKIVGMPEMRHKMKGTPFLRRFVKDVHKTKQFYDFIRNKTELAKQTRVEPQSEYDFASSTSSGFRKPWEQHDLNCIQKRFATIEKMPLKGQVMAIFNKEEVLNHIMDREGQLRCYEKVKNMFRKRVHK